MVFDLGLKLLEAKLTENANFEQFLGQKPWQFGPKWQGGGDITAYMAHPHAFDGAPTVGETVGVARIGRGAVLEGSVAT
jgi:hypothetical protein